MLIGSFLQNLAKSVTVKGPKVSPDVDQNDTLFFSLKTRL